MNIVSKKGSPATAVLVLWNGEAIVYAGIGFADQTIILASPDGELINCEDDTKLPLCERMDTVPINSALAVELLTKAQSLPFSLIGLRKKLN